MRAPEPTIPTDRPFPFHSGEIGEHTEKHGTCWQLVGLSGTKMENLGRVMLLKAGETGSATGTSGAGWNDPARKVFSGKDRELSFRALALDSCDGQIIAALDAEKAALLTAIRTTLQAIRPYKTRKYRLELRSYRCHKRCPSCPHYRLYAIDQNGAEQALSPTQTAFRACNFRRPGATLAPMLRRLQTLEIQLLLLHRARRRALRNSLDFLDSVQAWFYAQNFPEETAYFWPPEPSGPCTLLPNLALFHANQRLVQVYRAMQDQIYGYNAIQAHTRYHKAKQGVLGLYLRYWKRQHPGYPLLPQWRLYLRGQNDRWFATDQARYTSLQRSGQPPKKITVRNTPWFVYRSGNKAHRLFYRRYRLLLGTLEPLRTRLAHAVERYTATVRKVLHRAKTDPSHFLIKHLGEIDR